MAISEFEKEQLRKLREGKELESLFKKAKSWKWD